VKCGFITPNFGCWADARVLADLAYEAEGAGWDGFFVWDHLQFGTVESAADPWVALTAMAMRTEQIRLGPLVTPVPRRHIAKLARESATLDRLSNGRLILGVGAGSARQPEYTAFGDEGDPQRRAAKLDEGLEVLIGLWGGKPVDHHGAYYRVECPGFEPPVQQPRIPLWIAAVWPARKPLRRAARWDGVAPIVRDIDKGQVIDPSDFRELVRYIQEHRTSSEPFDVIQFGQTKEAGDTAMVRAYAEAGASWWIEAARRTPEGTRARLRKGPPRL
jgi:alkanesulfonate monooxygenase SsuD/methylene tetrahydromethanopterin reductase-like flavin-dependent oxidoreductase (luciferase family)